MIERQPLSPGRVAEGAGGPPLATGHHACIGQQTSENALPALCPASRCDPQERTARLIKCVEENDTDCCALAERGGEGRRSCTGLKPSVLSGWPGGQPAGRSRTEVSSPRGQASHQSNHFPSDDVRRNLRIRNPADSLRELVPRETVRNSRGPLQHCHAAPRSPQSTVRGVLSPVARGTDL